MAKKKTTKSVPAPKRPMVKVKKAAKKDFKPFDPQQEPKWHMEALFVSPYHDAPVSLPRYVVEFLSTDPHERQGAVEDTRRELSRLQDSYAILLDTLHSKGILTAEQIKEIVSGF